MREDTRRRVRGRDGRNVRPAPNALDELMLEFEPDDAPTVVFGQREAAIQESLDDVMREFDGEDEPRPAKRPAPSAEPRAEKPRKKVVRSEPARAKPRRAKPAASYIPLDEL